jgi:hypothetical protein
MSRKKDVLNRNDIIVGNEYRLTYPTSNKRKPVITVLSIDLVGDCQVQFKNNKKDSYHCSWLKKIE